MTTHDIVLVLYCLDIGHVLFPNKNKLRRLLQSIVTTDLSNFCDKKTWRGLDHLLDAEILDQLFPSSPALFPSEMRC